MIVNYAVRKFDLKRHPSDVTQYKALTYDVLRVSGDAYWITLEKAQERPEQEWKNSCTEIEGDHCGFGGFRTATDRLRASVEVFRSASAEYQKWFPGQKMAVMGRLYKHPEEQERGLGERMIQAAVEWCRRGNYPVLITAMRVDNLSAEGVAAGEARLIRNGFVRRKEPEHIENWADIPNNPAVQFWWTQQFRVVKTAPR